MRARVAKPSFDLRLRADRFQARSEQVEPRMRGTESVPLAEICRELRRTWWFDLCRRNFALLTEFGEVRPTGTVLPEFHTDTSNAVKQIIYKVLYIIFL